MDEKKFKKIRQIAAIIGIVLLVGMYLVAIVAALGKSENAQAIFRLAIRSFAIRCIGSAILSGWKRTSL